MGAPFSLRLVTQPNTTLTTNIGFKPLKEGFFLERKKIVAHKTFYISCLLYTSPSPRDLSTSRMPSSA